MFYSTLIVVEILFAIRLALYWIGLWQQKEYRPDRMLSHFKSEEHVRAALLYYVDLSGIIRRPIQTQKSVLLTCFSLIAVLILLITNYKHPFFSLAITMATPIVASIVVGLFSLPTWGIKQVVILNAKKKLVNREHPLCVIGITGSYGKTSTKLLLAHVLQLSAPTFSTRESHNTLFSIAVDIRRFLKPEDRYAVIEYAAYKQGEIRQITNFISPDIAIITGITTQHVGLFETYQQLKKAKYELLQSLEKDGQAIINCEDDETWQLREWAGRDAMHWQCSAGGTWRVSDEHVLNNRLSFTLKTPSKHIPVNTKLIGNTYVSNVRSVLAVAELLKLNAEAVARALETFRPDHHFVQLKKGVHELRIIDDGKTSNPVGFRAAMQLANGMSAKKKLLITAGIVDLGKQSDDVHFSLGQTAGAIFDRIVYTNDQGYQSFCKGAKAVNKNVSCVKLTLILPLDLVESFRRGDMVLIEGKIPPVIEKQLYTL